MRKTIKHAFCMFYTLIKHGFLTNQSAQYGNHVCSEQDALSLFKGLQMGIHVLGFPQIETVKSQKCCHGNNTEGVILFLLCCTFLVPSLKNTAPIFLEIFLIQCFTDQVELFMMSSFSSFA